MRPQVFLLGICTFIITSLVTSMACAQLNLVEPGNRNRNQPAFPTSTQKKLSDESWRGFSQIPISDVVEERYQAARRMITGDINSDHPTLSEIKRAGAIYGIDPIHILGAIMGEHTYNVGGVDQVQDFIAVMASWAPDWAMHFNSNGISLEDTLARPEFTKCPTSPNYEYWFCAQDVWQAKFRGKDGMPNSSLRMTFFDPYLAGHTYGLGQLDPLRALMVADLVYEKSGLDLISIKNIGQIYGTIVNPYSNVHYIAANIFVIIETYKKYSGFDISQNPGLTATLYNLGNEKTRALNLKKANAGGEVVWPEENYYGWEVNNKEGDLRAILDLVP